ncbi:MAG: hypothetical protein ACRBC3_15790 [Burkholderiaceae bacterium]
MAEPYLNLNQDPPDPTSDEALERALEKVRAEARARVRQRKKIAAEAAKSDTPAQEGARQPSEYVQRQASDRRSRPRSTSPDRRQSVASAKPAAAVSRNERSTGRTEAQISEKLGVRPALIFSLALAIICAVGMLSIRAIHSATPPIEGFAKEKSDAADSDMATADEDPMAAFNRPVTAALMRTQGWVLPSDIQTIDRALARARRAESPDLAPEVALVPALDMDIETDLDLALLATDPDGEDPPLPLAPPPPMPQFGGTGGFTPSFGSDIAQPRRFQTGPRLALPPMRPFGGNEAVLAQPETTDPLAGLPIDQPIDQPMDNSLAAANPAPQQPPASSMIEEINRSGQPTTPQPQATLPRQPERPAAAPKPPATLAQLQESSCARLGFFSRVSCKDKVRDNYCENRWNKHPDCARLQQVNNF